ncbi:hypothetical protein GDO86_002631 [Hymenochirus boettgeri]|uniref:Rho GTPase activating protein 31 n=1 Tax=Hymenochirus boettgeri TaxID=247094 RepID=A0A8T2K374_9PIPI|nr:hypothetical protein GDO86_002631 [Hymenochirus boettgeri]
MEVRVQQVVIEFILNHVDQIFNKSPASPVKQKEECRVMMMKSMTLPLGSLPMKLVSLEEAQAMSLSATHPARKERRENSLPEIVPVTGTLFHTVIDLPENKRKLSTKSKKWKSIFNLGKSGSDSKSKLSRNGSVFIRGQKDMTEKATIRPAKSMDSLCSLPAEGEDEKVSRFKRSVGTGGFFIPVLKSRSTGTGSTCDVSKHENEWEIENATGAAGGSGKTNNKVSQPKAPPEQMKVFRVGDDLENEQTSPKIRKMFYTASDAQGKANFPGSLFPLEASPRHQRKAMNISEPFAVSVPLRVSAVISSNSTPCRASSKDRLFLSSLEELPLLEPDLIARSPTLETCSHTGIKERPRSPTIGNSNKQEAPKKSCSNSPDEENLNEEATLSIKEILLEMMQEQEASEMAERKTTSGQGLASVDILEPTVGSSLDGTVRDVAKDQQEENSTSERVGLAHSEQEDPVPLSFLDPLWSDIQQELKIVESEEEFAISDNTPEFSQAPSPSVPHKCLSDTVSPGNITEGSTQSPIVSGPNSDGGNESPQGIQQGLSEQESRLSDQGKLEGFPPSSSSQAVPTDVMEPILPQLEKGKGRLSGNDKGSWINSDSTVANKDSGFSEPVKREIGVSDSTSFDPHETLIPVSLRGDENQQPKRLERKSNESIENDDELGGQTLELEEFWEDHQWVTSPLHSPKLKNLPEKDGQMIHPKRRGTTGELFKRPEFTRSLSLDSKDTRVSKWTCKPITVNKGERLLHQRSENDAIYKQNACNQSEQTKPVIKLLNLSTIILPEKQSEAFFGITEHPKDDSVLKISPGENDETFHSTLTLPVLTANKQPLPVSSDGEKSGGVHVTEKPKTRPSSLILDPPHVTGEFFEFERASSCGSKDRHCSENNSTKVSSFVKFNHVNEVKEDPWLYDSGLHAKDTDFNPPSHAASGRRNSAPVSVSAVRASFMIKMCQAKAVPVIPPKVQYTQIPQPLQTVNVDTDVPSLEKKESVCPQECNSIVDQTLTSCNANLDKPKNPKPENEGAEEKENNVPIPLDSSYPADSRITTQDAPVLRRKRTSGEEANGDTLLASKMERASGFSKSNYRSRPGRPQSLILFSPPFPIMDHPAPVDSRILLSPIKSPSQTTSQDSTLENQRTLDGVVLRNKLTIPKNGQRLETSTSCFYQPQRRSVILDSRSGRQIE